MIMDALAQFSDSQALSSLSSGDQDDSTYCLDLTGGNKAEDGWTRLTSSNIADKFRGGTVYLNVMIDVDGSGTSGAHVDVELFVHSASSTFKSGNKLCVVSLPPIPNATAGTIRSVSVPNVEFASTERYMGLAYHGLAAKTSSMTVSAWLSSVPGDTQVAGYTLT